MDGAGTEDGIRTMTPPLVLGSASPRRARILSEMGLAFTVVALEVDEVHDGGDPVGTVIANADRKHRAIRPRCPDACLITADTLVFFEGRSIGKPRNVADAAGMLGAFSGKAQIVFTAVAFSLPGHAACMRVEASTVCFKTLDDSIISDYIESVRPLDRAGAYDIDAQGDRLIAAYHGSRTNVMGLSAECVSDWLRAHHPSMR